MIRDEQTRAPIDAAPNDLGNLLSLAAIWQAKWWIIGCVGLCVGAGWAYIQRATPIFEAQARVLIRQEGSSVDRQRPARDDREFLSTQAEIIRSPLTVGGTLKVSPITRPPKAPLHKDDVTLTIAALTVAPIPKTDVLTISYRSGFKDEVAPLVNGIIEQYQAYMRQEETSANSEVLVMITKREADLRQEIATAENELLKLRAEGPLVGQGRDTINVHAGLLRDLSQRLTETRTSRLETENRLRALVANGDIKALDNERLFAIVESNTRPAIVAVDKTAAELVAVSDEVPAAQTVEARKPVVTAYGQVETVTDRSLHPMLSKLMRGEENIRETDIGEIQQELWRAKARAREVSNQYGVLHSNSKAVNEQVELWEQLLRTRLMERTSAITTGLADDHATMLATEKTLRQIFDEERLKAKELDNYILREKLTVDNIARLENLHDVVIKLLTDVEIEEQIASQGRSSVTIQVLEEPERTLTQVWPLPRALLALCGVVGTCGGLMLSSLFSSSGRRQA